MSLFVALMLREGRTLVVPYTLRYKRGFSPCGHVVVCRFNASGGHDFSRAVHAPLQKGL